MIAVEKNTKKFLNSMKKNNFKQITFSGIKPSGYKNDCTTIFYRPLNCFNI